ncbi:hypothetical protein DERF_011472 [Dermatophagoides farinae]|uniref:Uncharacterized protein n=1 Tax=Dermatophagoides farinae TaxID=6954 RepID=A0A922KZJ0_DERFA|nr:hypothetical protein DERF_011472 [Dermatophagoides farinae]
MKFSEEISFFLYYLDILVNHHPHHLILSPMYGMKNEMQIFCTGMKKNQTKNLKTTRALPLFSFPNQIRKKPNNLNNESDHQQQ